MRPGSGTLGQRLREARRALGLTQDELGRPDFTKGFISLLEHDRAKPSVASLERIAGRLGRPVSYFLEGGEAAISAKFVDVLRSRGRAELTRGRFDAAVETFREMRRIAAAHRDAPVDLDAAAGEGEALLGLGRLDDAEMRLRDLCAHAQASSLPALECRASRGLAAIEFRRGRYGRAAALSRTAVDLAGRTGGVEPSLRGDLYLQLGAALSRLGRLDEAAEAHREAERIFEETTRADRVGEALYGLGGVLAREGDHDGAIVHFERARELFEQYEDLRSLSRVRREAGALLVQMGRAPEAREHIAAALDLSRRLGDSAEESRTLIDWARCLHACGDAARAREIAERAATRAREARSPDDVAKAEAVLGRLAAAAGDMKEAQQRLTSAAQHCERAGLRVELVGIYNDLAHIAGAAGRYRDAAQYHERAFRLLQSVPAADIPDAVRGARSMASPEPTSRRLP